VLWVYDRESNKELVRATTYDHMTITSGSMVKNPAALHGGAYPSVTVYDYRHGDDRARFQLNDTGVIHTYLPYDVNDMEVWKYLTSIGSNGVYYLRRSSNTELALDLPSLKVKGCSRNQICSSLTRGRLRSTRNHTAPDHAVTREHKHTRGAQWVHAIVCRPQCTHENSGEMSFFERAIRLGS